MSANTGDGPPVFALLGAGGTGGHTYPALALARELVARGHAIESVRFVGGNRGLEGRVVPEAGFPIDLLPLGHGLQRKLTLANVRVIVDAVRAFVARVPARRPVEAARRGGLRWIRVVAECRGGAICAGSRP